METNNININRSKMTFDNTKSKFLRNSLNILANSENFSAKDFIHDCELIRTGNNTNNLKNIFSEKEINYIKALSTNRGWIHKELTRGYQKLLVTAYIKDVISYSQYKIDLTAFYPTGYLNVEKFKAWLRSNNFTQLEPYIINRYINNIKICNYNTELKILNDGDYKNCSLLISKPKLLNEFIYPTLKTIINNLLNFEEKDSNSSSIKDKSIKEIIELYQSCQTYSCENIFINSLNKIFEPSTFKNYAISKLNSKNWEKTHNIVASIINKNSSLGCLFIEQLINLVQMKSADTDDLNNQVKVMNTNLNWQYIIKIINLYLNNCTNITDSKIAELILKLNAISCSKFSAAMKKQDLLVRINKKFPKDKISSSNDISKLSDLNNSKAIYKEMKHLENLAADNLLNKENLLILKNNFNTFNKKFDSTKNKINLHSFIQQTILFGNLSTLSEKIFTNLPYNHLQENGLKDLTSKMFKSLLPFYKNFAHKSNYSSKNKPAADAAMENYIDILSLYIRPIKNPELAILTIINIVKDLLKNDNNNSYETLIKIFDFLNQSRSKILKNISHIFTSDALNAVNLCNRMTEDINNSFLNLRQLLLNKLLLNMKDNLEQISDNTFNHYCQTISELVSDEKSRINLSLNLKNLNKEKKLFAEITKKYLDIKSKKIESNIDLNNFISFSKTIALNNLFDIKTKEEIIEFKNKIILRFTKNQLINSVADLLDLLKTHKELSEKQLPSLFENLILNSKNVIVHSEEELLNIISAYNIEEDNVSTAYKINFMNTEQKKLFNSLCFKMIFNYMHNDGNCIKNTIINKFINETINPQYAISYTCSNLFKNSYELNSLKYLEKFLSDIDSLIKNFNLNIDEDSVSLYSSNLFRDSFINAHIIYQILNIKLIKEYFESHIIKDEAKELNDKGKALLTILINLLENKITFSEFKQILDYFENNNVSSNDNTINKIFSEEQQKDFYSKVYDPTGLDNEIQSRIYSFNGKTKSLNDKLKPDDMIICKETPKNIHINSTIDAVICLKQKTFSILGISGGTQALNIIGSTLKNKGWRDIELYYNKSIEAFENKENKAQ